jgi:hypothetical protein
MGNKASHFFKDTVGGGFRHFGNMTSHFAQRSFHSVSHNFSRGWHNFEHGAVDLGGSFRHLGGSFKHFGQNVAHTAVNSWHSFESLHPLNILKGIANTGLDLVKTIVSIPLQMIMPHPPAPRKPNSIHPSEQESNHLNSNTTQERTMLTYGAIIISAGVVIYLIM